MRKGASRLDNHRLCEKKSALFRALLVTRIAFWLGVSMREMRLRRE
jgi:hypothetical protein